MSQAREIRGQIASIKNTQKITSAMELVAASKMRKTQEQMQLSRPFSEKIREVISHIAYSHSEDNHPYLGARKERRRVGYIVVSTDRGLCGGLNINLFRHLLKDMQEWEQKNVKMDLFLIGKKAENFFKRIGAHIVGKTDHIDDKPSMSELVKLVGVMLDKFNAKDLDAIYLVGNDFVNTMVQKPFIRQLLPLKKEALDLKTIDKYWDYIYEPDSSTQLMSQLMVRYIESQVYQAVVENIACEQGARMVAMKSATDNAGSLIDELQLVYNKARQASITQEISEIVAGAAAVE